MRQQELIRRADLALSDLANDGGLLQPQQANRFIRRLIDSPTIINDARTITMRNPTMELNKIGFGERVLRAARNSSQQRSGPYAVGQRALLEAERAKPTTSKIELATSEVMAEIDLPYEVLEDNIEGSQMRNTIMSILADRVALDLEELILLGDRDSADPYLALQDGVLALAEANVVNHGGAPVDIDLFKNMAKALPTQYLSYLNQYKTYVAPYREIDYRAQVAQRQTALGDAIISGKAAPTIMGVPLTRAAKMPQDQAILTIPNNIIFGVQRDMRIEYDTDIRERVFIIVLTMRIAVGIEEEDMIVKATNIGDE
jgi:HK97 family phage major capsid protein